MAGDEKESSVTSLFNKFDILAAPGKPFVVCSSEEAARAAQRILGHIYVATTWPEEAGAWQSVDLSPLIKRDGLLIAANTPDAQADMHGLAKRLLDVGCKLRWTDTSAELADWSVTSWTGDAAAFIEWAKVRTTPYTPTEELPAMPPSEFPPEATDKRPKRPLKPRLLIVEGNTALAPQEEEAPAPEPLSEDGFASQFADRYYDTWRRVSAWDKWFFWNGDGWIEDREDARVQPMRELIREQLAAPIASHLTPDGRRKMSRQALIYASVRLSGTDPKLRTTPEVWDADPWKLGVPGGVIDLTTGKMLASSREQCITMRASCAPASGKPVLWLKMLEEWTGGDADVIGWLRRYLGYALTGDNREQCMAFFYGPAQAGKGTVLRTVAGILGSVQDGSNPFRSYHYEAPITTFLESRNERHTTELAALYGKRLITAEEPQAGAKWDEGKLKWITGGSQITARYISRDNFSFTMTGKIIVAANHRPRLATSDKAIRRRLHVVPFEHPVADEDRDNNLDAKLRAEWPQILAWMLDACMEWQQCGLGLPERIAASTDTYLESEDTLGSWLEECCDRSGESPGAALYDNYRKWCETQGEHAFARRGWANALVERGFEQRKSHGVRLFRGLSTKLGANL